MSKLLIIYPVDSTTRFLSPIIDALKEVDFHSDIEVLQTKLEPESPNNKDTINLISKAASNDIIVFLGHGSRSCLYGPPISPEKQNVLIDRENSKTLFGSKQFISLSCWSHEFIKNINALESGIGFGNLPTTWKEFHDARQNGKIYKEYTIQGAEVYKNAFVIAFAKGLVHGLQNSFSVKSVFLFIKLHLNRAIDNCARGDDTDIYAGKLLYKLRNEMTLIQSR